MHASQTQQTASISGNPSSGIDALKRPSWWYNSSHRRFAQETRHNTTIEGNAQTLKSPGSSGGELSVGEGGWSHQNAVRHTATHTWWSPCVRTAPRGAPECSSGRPSRPPPRRPPARAAPAPFIPAANHQRHAHPEERK